LIVVGDEVVWSDTRLNQSAPVSHRPTPDRVLPSVSVIVPVFNESDRIERSLGTLWHYFEERREAAEILVVDDGSSDDTVARVRAFAADHAGVTLLAERHRGKAAAVLAGMQRAGGCVVGFMDIDLATPLETWERCQKAIDEGAGVAIASREGMGSARVGEPWYRHLMGRVFNGLVQILHDTQCGFKFFSREAMDDILPRQQLYRDAQVVSIPRVTAFDVELLYIARRQGHRIAVIPVTWHYGDHSKVNPITDTLQNVRDVLMVRINGWRGRYDRPQRDASA
jgi:dolichyl-phosphate beta-glucosyltransferase